MTRSPVAAVLAALIMLFNVACGDDDNTTPQKDIGTTQKDVGGTQKDTGGTQKDTGGTQKDTGGTQKDTGGTTSCSAGCHAFPPTSGKHAKHVAKGMSCSSCHSESVDSAGKIISGGKHKNGSKDVKGSFTWDSTGKSCSSLSCHGTKTW